MAVFRRQTLAKCANKHGEVTVVYKPVVVHCTIVSLIGSCVVTSLIGILHGCWLKIVLLVVDLQLHTRHGRGLCGASYYSACS